MQSNPAENAEALRSIPTPTLVQVHPIVLMTIVDAFERRRPRTDKVVGALLGRKTKTDCIEITECFVVPHDDVEGGSISIDSTTFQTIHQLYRQSAPNEKLMGWFSTCADELEIASNFHRWWLRYAPQPIFLTVDCRMKMDKKRMQIKSYVGVPTTGSLEAIWGGDGIPPAFQFVEVPIEVQCWPAERAGLDLIQEARQKPEKVEKVPTDVEAVLSVAQTIDKLLSRCIKYVEDAKGGDHDDPNDDFRGADQEMGRALTDMVKSIPRINEDDYDRLISSGRKDLLMAMFVSQTAESQVALQEKANMVAF